MLTESNTVPWRILTRKKTLFPGYDTRLYPGYDTRLYPDKKGPRSLRSLSLAHATAAGYYELSRSSGSIGVSGRGVTRLIISSPTLASATFKSYVFCRFIQSSAVVPK